MRRPPVRPLIRIRFFKQCGIDRHDAGLQVDLKSSTIEGKFGSQAKFTRVFNSSTAKDDLMARDEDDDDGLPPLGENTDKFLDQAKKGQPRNFLLVCKGNKVTYLAVRKKPVKKNELNEAKKSGYKGEGYFGVITGKGMELVFNLSTADGYTAEPVKDKVLKDFLEEKANFKCKPTIVIVATLPAIPFDDEDLSNPLIARFLALGERISQVLDARPDAESELTKTVSGIRLLLQDGDFQTAEPLVTALETRLQELLSGAQSNSPAPPATPPATATVSPIAPPAPAAPPPAADNDAFKLKLQEALNKLVPQLKQAVVTYPDKKVELLTPVALIKKQMDAGELQEAKQGILAVGLLLKSVMAQASAPGGGESQTPAVHARRAEYERKLEALQPSYLQVLMDMLGDTSKFRAIMAYATEQAEAGAYENAIKAIDRLAQAVSQALLTRTAPTTVGENLPGDAGKEPDAKKGKWEALAEMVVGKAISEQFQPNWEQAKALWLTAVDNVNDQLSRLRVELLNQQDSDLRQIAEFGLNAVTDNHRVPLQASIMNVDKASGPSKAKFIVQTREFVEEFKDHIETDEQVEACDDNPFDVAVSIRSSLGNALAAMDSALERAFV